MSSRFEIVQSFTFEAAHYLKGFPKGHAYARLHGHSFRAEVAIGADAPGSDGFILDFEEIEKAISALRTELDHGYLNEIAGLEQPTLENIAQWIAKRLHPRLPALVRVSLYRESCGQACHFRLD